MNPDLPPTNREDLEAQVTALLLGELSAEQAAALRARMAQDRELAQWHDRLKETLALVRETAATPAGETVAQPAPLKLSEARRQKLLAHFKTVRPKELMPLRRRWLAWLVPLAAAAVLVLMVAKLLTPSYMMAGIHKAQNGTLGGGSELIQGLLSSLTPNFTKARSTSQENAIINNLRLLDSSKQQWALEHQKSANAVPTSQDITPYFGRGENGEFPAMPGVTYHLGSVGQAPFAEVNGRGGKKTIVTLPGAVPFTETPLTVTASPAQQPGSFSTDGSGLLAQAEKPVPPAAPTPVAAPPIVLPPADVENRGTANFDGASGDTTRSTFQSGFGGVGRVGGFSRFVGGGGGGGAPPAGEQGSVSGAVTNPLLVDQLNNGPVDTARFYINKDSRPLSAITDDQFRASVGKEAEGQVPILGDVPLLGALGGQSAAGKVTTVSGDKKQPREDAALPKAAVAPLVPQPEVQTRHNAFSTFSLNVSDVAFKLAAASLEKGVMPEAASMRSEEFINAFDYRDPEPAPGAPIGFAWERAGDPFAHNRDFLRFSIKTAAQGREAGRPLNLVLLLDKSGSMERADRVEIIRQALNVLAAQLQAHDTLSVVVFARTAHLWADGVSGSQAGELAKKLGDITPEGGTNLEEAMKLAYATALRHYLASGENRVVLLTDGAANLGEVDPGAFKPWVESNRKQGIALDCFGVGWDGYNDTTLEALSRGGGGRYGFINTPEEAATGFAAQLAGALRVAASDVKVQVEFNPNRVVSYRQIGYARHQLTKEQFRDNTVRAAQIGAAESGNALYTVEVNAAGDGPLCTVRVRYRDPGTSDYHEHAWDVPYTGSAMPLEMASPAMRLAASAGAFSELLAGSAYAGEVTFDKLLVYLSGVPAVYGADARPRKLEWMVRQAKSISGK
jgi:Mg-chelatase subunit ChlD